MKVKATWHHVMKVTREVEVDWDAFTEWRDKRYGDGADTDLALAVWIDDLDTDDLGEIFRDWRTSQALPSDFELAYSEVIDAEHEPPVQPTRFERSFAALQEFGYPEPTDP